MGNGKRTRRHIATKKVDPDKGLPKEKPTIFTEITSYRTVLDEKLNDLSQCSSGSSTVREHTEPGVKYEVAITVAHKQYSSDILPTHEEVQECLTALFRRVVEKKIRIQNKMK